MLRIAQCRSWLPFSMWNRCQPRCLPPRSTSILRLPSDTGELMVRLHVVLVRTRATGVRSLEHVGRVEGAVGAALKDTRAGKVPCKGLTAT